MNEAMTWPAVSEAERALVSAEMLAGLPIPDLAEQADVEAWRAEHTELIGRGEEALAVEAAAVRAAAEADLDADVEPEAEP
jgi:hypothetical protein